MRHPLLKLVVLDLGEITFEALTVGANGHCAPGSILHGLGLPSTTSDARTIRVRVGDAARDGRIGKGVKRDLQWMTPAGVTWEETLRVLAPEATYDDEWIDSTQLRLMSEYSRVRLRLFISRGDGTFYHTDIAEEIPADSPIIRLLYHGTPGHYWILHPLATNPSQVPVSTIETATALSSTDVPTRSTSDRMDVDIFQDSTASEQVGRRCNKHCPCRNSLNGKPVTQHSLECRSYRELSQ